MTDIDELAVAGTAVLLRPTAEGFAVLLMRRPDRGSFAGAWVFPGGKVEPSDRREGADESDDARRAAVRETAEEVGLIISDPVLLSRWQPPIEVPVRIRTWFFLASAPEGEARFSVDEVVDAMWLRPAEALARHAAGEWTLFPPTWVTLHQLSRFASVDAALASAGVARHFSTRVVESPQGRDFEWDGVRLRTGALPWTIDES
ncbi:NUDIX domain-containing protein [Microbacterium sp. APC 3901]|uniref:NUDIX hydrolase n=1 Tax=Microbacterium sp. APC 3901 TaxID=3035192 RepID=UPI0025B3469D|nr:NUDIX domain-containing protein [Microbacterium sp. APC 3901]MDN3443469.1 NUDIX domain-containing protein [Microbacterium sp. APC 3901]